MSKLPAPSVLKNLQKKQVGVVSKSGGGVVSRGSSGASLPNATVIYGVGAGLILSSSFVLFSGGRWFAGAMTFIIGGCLAGFALHLLKHRD